MSLFPPNWKPILEQRFMNYADKWTKNDEMNPAYPVFDQNCANFVSQAIHEGGKPTHPRLWTYSTSIPRLTTKGWMNADSNRKSGNRHQITLTQSLQYAHANHHDNMTWYGLQYRYD